jgi:hypothetical protein
MPIYNADVPKCPSTLTYVTDPNELPPKVPRTMAARFARLHPRTLSRAEQRGELTPFRRNSKVVSYDREELLRWLGFTFEPAKSLKRRVLIRSKA